MLDYGTHQILHKQRQRDLIAQSEHDRLVHLARPHRKLRLPTGAFILRLLRHAARPMPTLPSVEPEPRLQVAGEDC